MTNYAVFLAFIAGLVAFNLQAYYSYDKTLQSKWYFYPAAVSFGMLSTILWFYIAKATEAKNTYFWALAWDSSLILIFAIFPILISQVKLTFTDVIGVALVLQGLILLRMNG